MPEASLTSEQFVPHRLARMLTPRSVALVGASTRPGSVGNAMVRTLVDCGYQGRIELVNPRYPTVEDRACQPSLEALAAAPDLVVAAVGAGGIEAVLDQSIAVGAGGLVIFDACHGHDREGKPLIPRLRDKAREAGLPVCGGNAMGFYNLPLGCHASFYSLPDLKPGGITLIAHSGSVFTVLALNDPRYRFDLVVSSGQEIGTTLDEYIDYALERPETRVIALFMESARDPGGFAAALAKAGARGIPVVACKVGRTADSARLALSHSGALVGDAAAYDAVLERHGAVKVETVDQLMNAALLLSQGRSVGAGELGLVTDSGGLREALIDRAGQRGVPLAAFSGATLERLENLLPAPLVPSNPLDCAGALAEGFDRVFEGGLRAVAEDPGVALLGYEFDGRDDYLYHPGLARLADELPRLTDKPCFAYSSFANTHNRGLAERLADLDVPLLNGLDEVLSAADVAFRWRDLQARRARADPPPPAPPAPLVGLWRERLSERGLLSEAEGLALLQDFGIPVVAHRQAEGWPAVRQAAEALGFPLACKSAAKGLAHKSDAGGVCLNLGDQDVLADAYREMEARLSARVLLQRMAPRGIELAFGCIVDRDFGPLVMVSAGGTLIEVLADRSFALAPLGVAEAGHMIEALSCRKLLDGQRGVPPADVAALTHALARFSVLCDALAEVLAEIDVNPVIVAPEGLLAVDALVAGKTAA